MANNVLSPKMLDSNRLLSTFQLPPALHQKLLSSGFSCLRDLQGIGPIALAKELSIPPQKALDIFKTIAHNLQLPEQNTNQQTSQALLGQSAMGHLEREVEHVCIITFSQEIDSMLGGGVPLGKITEFCGVPGIGKTQMAIQLAVNAHIPVEYFGPGGTSIYIDSEGSFMSERAFEIAESVVEHLTNVRAAQSLPLPPTTLQILEGIHYYRIHDYIEQLALLNILPTFLESHPTVRVIVWDSISFHFRQDFADMGLRTRLLQGMGNQMMEIACRFNVAVVLINQVTTKVVPGGKSELTPALGQSWSHVPTNRVMLLWKNGQRYANLIKSPTQQNKTVPYAITLSGIRDLPVGDTL